jgi:acyl-CoA synthetase (AMP-forming)/AMP-acid ligase II
VNRAALAQGQVVGAEGKGSAALVCVGKAMPGHEVQVVTADLELLPPRQVGHVVVRGPSVMQGYYRDSRATNAVLRGDWLWTGDLGYFTERGLFITGRAKDLIIVRGKNFYAEDLERTVERIEGVRPSGVVAFGLYDEQRASDLVVMVCETRLTAEGARQKLVEQLGEAVAEHNGLTVDEVVLVPPGTIPRTSSGKRQRSLCRELYVKGELRPRITGKLKLTWVFVRSSAGYVSLITRGLLRRLRVPK